MVAFWFAIAALGSAALAEWLHTYRVRRVAHLAFGPDARPRVWARTAPLFTAIATAALAWGLVTLWELRPKVHQPGELGDRDRKHLVLVLDVSPSMYLKDAGPERNSPRRMRASDVITSLFRRLPMREYRLSLIGFYSAAKPLLQESTDIEMLKYLLEELPTHLGFPPGKTNLFAGLGMVSQVASKWRPGSATLIVLTDGMTVPAEGMPRLPAAVDKVLVVGVGDPAAGRFIDGHQSRQDVATLRQVAARLGGTYHNGNAKHIPTSTIQALRAANEDRSRERWSRREWALLAVALGAALLALLPPLLHAFGTEWRPGIRRVAWT